MINISFFPSFFRQTAGLIHMPAVVSDSLNLNTLLTPGSIIPGEPDHYRVASSAILDATTAMVSSPVSKPLREASKGLTLRSSS